MMNVSVSNFRDDNGAFLQTTNDALYADPAEVANLYQDTGALPSSAASAVNAAAAAASNNPYHAPHQSVIPTISPSLQSYPVAAAAASVGKPVDEAVASGPMATTTAAPSGGAASGVPGEKVDVKLFVGRLPKSVDTDAVRELFTPFGEVLEVIIIRDKITQQHKGSAFVKMASLTDADAAVRALANQKVIDPQLGALQVRYANGEVERLGLLGDASEPGKNLGKLFIGSLPRGLNEESIRPLFEPFGPIQEIVLMKDTTTGTTKGCGFVKYEFKEHAIQAVRALHESRTMEGVPRPLEVKFAENKRAATIAAAGVPAAAAGGVPRPVTAAQIAASNAQPRAFGGWTEYFSQEGRPYYYNEEMQKTQWTVPPEFEQHAGGGAAAGGTGGAAKTMDPSSAAAGAAQPGAAAAQTGPLGANVFVFHIPFEWTQREVHNHFSPYGQIVSCYVAVDRTTGRNRGYAFVSFSTVEAACMAVRSANGQSVGNKRLKVSIKTGEEQYAAPYMNMNAVASAATPVSVGGATPVAAAYGNTYYPYNAVPAYGYYPPTVYDPSAGAAAAQQQHQHGSGYRILPY